ncbi:MAG TPA: 3-deoxy-manno-octulosonate cytidylyltransferase [Fimbriiglobus sp.]
MKPVVVIPARFASSRLPGKPLLRHTGKFLVQHVYERALQATRVSGVVVATDDDRIVRAVESFGGKVMMSRADHPSGTDRVAEVAIMLGADAVINLQGDEPDFDPAGLDRLADMLNGDASVDCATLATPIREAAAYRNPNVVKVVSDDRGRALYFSRAPIPFGRDGDPDFVKDTILQHLGVYAFRTPALLQFTRTPPHPLERIEKLEQLRLLGTGVPIAVGIIAHAAVGIDTPDDYARFVRAWFAKSGAIAA